MDMQLSNENKELIYDLRQYYARIVGEILIEIAVARQSKNFVKYYENLYNLYTEIDMKLDDDDRDEIIGLWEETIEILATHSEAYFGTSTDDEERFIIEDKLRNLDMMLKRKMNEKKMFGSKRDTYGLM